MDRAKTMKLYHNKPDLPTLKEKILLTTERNDSAEAKKLSYNL
jgi:hypothetical protein